MHKVCQSVNILILSKGFPLEGVRCHLLVLSFDKNMLPLQDYTLKLMKRIATILIFVTSVILSFAQNLDSLIVKYDSRDRATAINAANEIYTLLYEEKFCDSLITFSEKDDKDKVDANVLAVLSDYLVYNQHNQQAKGLAVRASKAAEKIKDDQLAATSYSTLMVCCQNEGNYDAAFDYARKCFEIDLREGIPSNLSSSYNNLAAICFTTKHLDEAKEYIDNGVKIERTLNRNSVLAIRLGLASEIYATLGEYDDALKFANEAYELDYNSHNTRKVGIRMCQIAAVYQTRGSLDDAEKMYLRAIQPLQESGNTRSLSICYNSLGNIVAQEGRSDEAEKYFLKATKAAEQSGYTLQLLKSYEALSQLLKDRHPADAIEYFERSAALRDSLFTDESQRQINNFNVQYQTREKETQIEIQRLEIARQRSRQLLLILILVLCAISIVLLVLFVLLQRRHNKELKESDALKSKFFSIISHDLKNPVIAQKNALEVICNNYDRIPADVLHEQCLELMNSSNSLLDLLYNLLNWSRIEMGRMQVTPLRFDLCEAVKDVEAILRTQMKNKRQTLAIESPQQAIALADRNMITTVLRNVVSNAIKFSREGAEILIRIESKGEFWTITVTDSGVGMSEETLNSLFKMNSNKSAVGTAGEQGSGLGLLICRELLEKNGSTIDVTSSEGVGTSVMFTVKAD